MDLKTALDHVREQGYLIAWSSAEDTRYVAHSVEGRVLDRSAGSPSGSGGFAGSAANDLGGVPIPYEVAEELLFSGMLEDLSGEGCWPNGRDKWVSAWYRIRDIEREHAIAELERNIAELIARKTAAVEGSAEYRMAIRMLVGLRSRHEDAGGIIESLDPDWGCY